MTPGASDEMLVVSRGGILKPGGLDTRPGAVTLGLDEVVEMAWDGRIRVPPFQRDFKWGSQDVQRLFESIVLRYPVGSLLLWRRHAPAQRVVLGALEIDAPDDPDARWVVDGQQRITSLANVLRPESQADPRFSLGYDLREQRVLHIHNLSNPFVIPFHVVFDLAGVLRWFAQNPEAAEFQDRAFELAKHLREFSVPAYQVIQDDVHVLQDIFDRMNNYGKRLSRAEVFSALNAGTESENPDTLTISKIASNVGKKHSFGKLDEDTVLRAILARRGPDIQREIRLEFVHGDRRGVREFFNESRDDAYRGGEAALDLAVSFLIQHGVPHFAVLPYKYLLIVLTRFFAHFPQPGEAYSRLLGRWFWRAALLGPEIFKGSATGAARTLCGRVHPGDLEGSIRNLLESLTRGTPQLPDLRKFRTNEAATKIVICSWWARQPRNPETGRIFTRPELAELLVDRPTAADAVKYLFPHRDVPDSFKVSAANRVLSPQLEETTTVVGGVLLELLHQNELEHQAEVLDSLNVDQEVLAFIEQDAVEEALTIRQNALEAALKSFINRKCEWDFEDTPPITSLLLDDLDASEY